MILFVCEGNVCRSALAEAVLRASLAPQLGITTGSAGTRALEGESADNLTAQVAAAHGISLAGHKARQLTPELLAGADMVITATRQIRSAAVQTYPPSVKYSFTLRQLERILRATESRFDSGGLTGAALVASLARSVNQEKSRLVAPQGNDDDIADPRGRSARIHEQVAEQVVSAVRELATALGGEQVAWAPVRGQRWDIPGTAAG
ncbi:MAG TPA: hypothetical protein VGK53_09565 [Propionicimonas sp.]|jgi:protein-tyrosine phosphatase